MSITTVGAQLIIEAATENYDLKVKILKLAAVTPEDIDAGMKLGRKSGQGVYQY